MSRTSANFLLLLAGLTWGMGFIAQQSAMSDIGPMLFVGLRFCLAALAVLPFALYEHRKCLQVGERLELKARDVGSVVLIGLAFFMGMALQQIALLYTSVTNAGFLTSLYVVMVPFISLVFLRERQHWAVWPCAFACVLGIYLLGGGLEGLNGGDTLTILCAVFWAIQVTLLGKTVQRIGRPVAITTVQFALCGLLGLIGHEAFTLLPGTAQIEPAFRPAALMPALPEIIYAALVAGAFAFTLQAIGQRYTKASDAAILLSSESMFAALFGALLLSERLTADGYLGCAILFAAIVAVQILPNASYGERSAIKAST